MPEIVVGRDDDDLKKFGTDGTIFLGKHLVGSGEDSHLTTPVLVDVLRPHLITVCGKRGCLTKETLVFTDKGFKPIAEFDEKSDKIYSYNKDINRFEWRESTLMKYKIRNEKLFQIDLVDGQRITATAEHPLLVSNGKLVFWRKAEELNESDMLVAVTNVPEIGKDKESLRIARLLGFILSDGTIGIYKGRWKDGRGYWYNGTKHRVRIFNNTEQILQQAKRDFEEEFDIKVRRYKRKDCNCEVIETLRSDIIKKIMKFGVPIGKKSNIIQIPKIVWESSNLFKANFVKALFSCDGYVSKKGDRIEYYSNSRHFLTDIQLLLLHFGIQSTVREKKASCNKKFFKSYRLSITDNISLEKFKKIGFFDKNKINRLKKRKKGNTTGRRGIEYLDENLFCTRIKKISKVDGINEVYDLSVPTTHSFIANNIISHNTGKSYTMGVIAEEILKLHEEVRRNLCALIVDTQGIYWTMKSADEKDIISLKDWNLDPTGFSVFVCVPEGQSQTFSNAGVDFDDTFSVSPVDLSIEDWISVFSLDPNEPLGILLQRTISKIMKYKMSYDIDNIINEIEKEQGFESEKLALINRFEAAKTWGIFGEARMPNILEPGKTTVLDISLTPQNVRCLLLGIISRKIFEERTKARRKEELAEIEGLFIKRTPMCWIFIDEAHNFLPEQGSTPATEPLLKIVKEGRQPGITLVFATQRPEKLHPDALAQCDMIISHRLTSKADIDALRNIMQTYMLYDIAKYLNELPKRSGVALILDDNSERLYTVYVRPRQSWHAGASPTAV